MEGGARHDSVDIATLRRWIGDIKRPPSGTEITARPL
jgi:hypothetical protein